MDRCIRLTEDGFYRHSRLLLRLFRGVLILTEPVLATPCNVVCRQHLCKVIIINGDGKFPAADAACFSAIPVRNTEPATFIVNHSVKRNPALRAEVEGQFIRIPENTCRFPALVAVCFIRNAVDSLVVSAVLFPAPAERLYVQLRDVAVCPAGQEVLFDESSR